MQPINSQENYHYVLSMRAWAQRMLDERDPDDILGRMSMKSHIEELDEIIQAWEENNERDPG